MSPSAFLARHATRSDPARQFLERWFIRLAGRLRLEVIVPELIFRFWEIEEETLADEAAMALELIGTDRVVRALFRDWDSLDSYDRSRSQLLATLARKMAEKRTLA